MNVKKFDTRPLALKIKEIVPENDCTNTYIFDYPLGSKPGQFVMLWIPGVDEKPFSVAYDNGKEFALTICKVGPATEELFKLGVGDRVGIRGPFGTHYEIEEGQHLALVSGGYGVAPMYFVTLEAMKKNCKIEFIVGARTKDLLLYKDRVKELGDISLHLATNDGSEGTEGFVTEPLAEVLKNNKIDQVFTCGPEVMMKAVGELAAEHDVDCSLSMEKYMKCGFGVCGQCCIDDTGIRACVEGPVMDWKTVKKLPELGSYHRDAQGKKHYM